MYVEDVQIDLKELVERKNKLKKIATVIRNTAGHDLSEKESNLTLQKFSIPFDSLPRNPSRWNDKKVGILFFYYYYFILSLSFLFI